MPVAHEGGWSNLPLLSEGRFGWLGERKGVCCESFNPARANLAQTCPDKRALRDLNIDVSYFHDDMFSVCAPEESDLHHPYYKISFRVSTKFVV